MIENWKCTRCFPVTKEQGQHIFADTKNKTGTQSCDKVPARFRATVAAHSRQATVIMVALSGLPFGVALCEPDLAAVSLQICLTKSQLVVQVCKLFCSVELGLNTPTPV